MRRKTFDTLISTAGLVMAAVLLAASGLLLWAHSFVSDNVRTQLTAEKIFFPKAGSDGLNDPAIKPYLSKYAGQQLVNGDQAKAYADHFIAVHLKGISGGKTYSELSAEAQAAPTDTVLAGKVATVFKGETLRGLLLNAYAFGTMAKVAFIGFWIALGSGLGFLLLGALGVVHARRTAYDVALHVPGWHPENQPVH
ncbi:MAG: hypothetical protein QOG99_3247 [Frankiales bacterium]|jgi:hypothetical protein|nr:hypothetical protein [Frankiales bacterium]